MNTCACCSGPLVRQISQGRIYWFCSSCWQETPNLEQWEQRRLLTYQRLHQCLERSQLLRPMGLSLFRGGEGSISKTTTKTSSQLSSSLV